MERVVLFRIEQFEQGTLGVAVVIVARNLVDLVENEERVVAFRLNNAFHDATAHGGHVSAPVSTDFALVVQTAERDTHVFAAQTFGNAAAKGGLTHPRRAHQTEDGGAMCGAHAEQCELFDDALLHFFHSVVVAVENAASMAQVAVVGGRFAPRQRGNGVEIGQRNAVVRAAGIEAVQLFHLLFEERADVVGQREAFDLGAKLSAFAVFPVTQFVVDVFQLLLQEILLLLPIDFAVRAFLNLFAQVEQLDFAIEQTQQGVSALHEAVFQQQKGLFLGGDGEIRGHEIDEKHRIADVLHRHLGFHAERIAHFHIVEGGRAELFAEGHKFLVVIGRKFFRKRGHGRHDERRFLGETFVQRHAAVGLNDGRRFLVGEFNHPQEFGQCADGVEVVKLRAFHLGVHLCCHCKIALIVGLIGDVTDECHRTFASDGHGGHDPREQHQVAQRENGKFPVAAMGKEVANVAVEVGDERKGVMRFRILIHTGVMQ